MGLSRGVAILVRIRANDTGCHKGRKMNHGVSRQLFACAIIGLLLVPGGGASAQEGVKQPDIAGGDPASATRPLVRRSIGDAVTLAGGLSVRLNKALYREGEGVTVTVDVPREGYLNVLRISPDDVANVLFPNQYRSENRVPAGPFTIPGEQMKFDLVADKRQGATLVAAFLSQEPLDLYQSGVGERDEADKLKEAFAGLSANGRRQLEKLAARSFVAAPQAAPLLAGMTYELVCATGASCDAPDLTPISGSVPPEERLTPGILLEPEGERELQKSVWLRRVNDKGIRLTKLSEGFVPRLYNDVERYCSIGHGHLVRKAACDGSEKPALRRGLSEAQAEALLAEDLRRAQRAVTSLVTTNLNDAQYAALCDFTYNVGAAKLEKSTLLKAVNAGEHDRVPFQLRRWTMVHGKEHRGLKIRREREIALYFEGRPIPKSPPGDEELTPIDIRVGE